MARRKKNDGADDVANSAPVLSDADKRKLTEVFENAEAQRAAGTLQSQEFTGPPVAVEQEPRFIRDTFTSSVAGVRAGEDKRFNAPQAFVDFADDQRATAEEKAQLSAAGFRYRPSDKGYSALANAASREARDEMAATFTERRLKVKAGQGEGNER